MRLIPVVAAAGIAAAGCHVPPPSPADLGPLVPVWGAVSSFAPDLVRAQKPRQVPPKKHADKREA